MLSLVLVALLGTPAPSVTGCPVHTGGQRQVTPASKGVELYSWPASDATLRYSLLWGTNRNKSDAEIKSTSCSLSGVSAVAQAFALLAEGEHVFWANELCPNKDCVYPSKDVIDTLRSHAKAAHVSLEPESAGGVQ